MQSKDFSNLWIELGTNKLNNIFRETEALLLLDNGYYKTPIVRVDGRHYKLNCKCRKVFLQNKLTTLNYTV